MILSHEKCTQSGPDRRMYVNADRHRVAEIKRRQSHDSHLSNCALEWRVISNDHRIKCVARVVHKE